MITQGAFTAIEFVRDVVVNTNKAGQRVYMDQAPQSAASPFVVISIVSREESPTQDDGSAVDEYRVQIDCYAKATSSLSAFAICNDLSEAIRSDLSRDTYTYDAGDPQYANNVDGVQESNYFTDYIPEIDLQRISTDYMIRIKTP